MKIRPRRKIKYLTAALVLLCFCPVAFSGRQAAASQVDQAALDEASRSKSGVSYSHPANQVTVKVGYFGGPYYDKTSFYIDGDNGKMWDEDGKAIPSSLYVDRTYSFIDKGDQVVIVKGHGVDLEDFLDLAGIDAGSVQFMHFPTTDQHIYSMTRSELSGHARYYFDALKDYEILDDFEDFEQDLRGTGKEIRPMLALTDNWQTEDMVNHSLRLLFGQTVPAETFAEESAKYIHSFIVQLGGTPSLETQISYDKVGSKYQVTVNLTTTDENGHKSGMDKTVAEQIAAGIKITSTNRNALNIPDDPVVNADGSISWEAEAGEGTAQLSISSDSYGGTISGDQVINTRAADGQAEFYDEKGKKVTVTETESPSKEEKPDKSKDQEKGEKENTAGDKKDGKDAKDSGGSESAKDTKDAGKGDGSQKSGDSSGSQEKKDAKNAGGISSNDQTSIADDANSDKNVQSLSDKGREAGDQETNDPSGQVNEEALSKGETADTEKAQTTNSVRVQRLTIDSDEGGVQNWRDTDMAEDAVELGKEEHKSTLPISGGAAAAVLAAGGIAHYGWYRKERRP